MEWKRNEINNIYIYKAKTHLKNKQGNEFFMMKYILDYILDLFDEESMIATDSSWTHDDESPLTMKDFPKSDKRFNCDCRLQIFSC